MEGKGLVPTRSVVDACSHYLLMKICVPWELGGLHLRGHTSIRHFSCFQDACFGLGWMLKTLGIHVCHQYPSLQLVQIYILFPIGFMLKKGQNQSPLSYTTTPPHTWGSFGSELSGSFLSQFPMFNSKGNIKMAGAEPRQGGFRRNSYSNTVTMAKLLSPHVGAPHPS